MRISEGSGTCDCGFEYKNELPANGRQSTGIYSKISPITQICLILGLGLIAAVLILGHLGLTLPLPVWPVFLVIGIFYIFGKFTELP